MKTTALWVFLLVIAFPLSGQSKSIYVPPVTGTGNESEDNAYIRNLLTSEVRARNFVLTQISQNADYVLIGTIIDWDMYYSYTLGAYGEDGTPVNPEGMFVLHMVLQDNHSGEIKAEQDLLYNTRNDIDDFFPVVSFYIFSRIIDTTSGQNYTEDELWRNKRWYLAAGVFWTPRVYVSDSQSVFWANPGFGFSAEYRFLNFLSAETGFGLNAEWVRYTLKDEDKELLLEIPLSVKFVIKPGSLFMLEPYTGIHFNIPLTRNSEPPPVSWRLGLQYGIKAGPGAIYLDTRFAIDLGTTTVTKGKGDEKKEFEYGRYTIYMGIGYKYGIGVGP